MSARPALTPGAVAAAMVATAELLGPELRRGTGLSGSVRLRVHAVEAILVFHPAIGPEAALALAGLDGVDAAARSAAEMSGDGWETRLVDCLARLLRLLDAHPRGPSSVGGRAGRVDLTPALMGDPDPRRSALGRDAGAARRATEVVRVP